MDDAEKHLYAPIIHEATRRGYKIRLTDNKFEKCDIGFYCQHINYPQYSKTSFVMLHDITQQYGSWPDIWFREPWNIYDVGFLPGRTWCAMWQQISKYYYARPRIGVFEVGWPKADGAVVCDQNYRQNLNAKYGLDNSKRTILYAPAWENDGKQDDFVKAMIPLNVNILIKQWSVPDGQFVQIAKNIHEMAKLHINIKNVFILNPKISIMEAIAMSDILVSEESSTMCEAVMMGIPAVSVSDWLIPDVSPSRYPEDTYSFVTTTTKSKLSDCIRDLLENYNMHSLMAKRYSRENFGETGNSAHRIMDVVDYVIKGKECHTTHIMAANVVERIPLARYLRHKALFHKRNIRRYAHENRLISFGWQMYCRAMNKQPQLQL
jgi:hypothetical protein